MGVLGDYKLQEMATPFKDWNGDTIYRCVVDCGALPNSEFKYVDISSLNIKQVLKLSGVSYNPTANSFFPLPFANREAQFSVLLAITLKSPYANTIAIETGSDRTTFTQTYVEVVYTKNT